MRRALRYVFLSFVILCMVVGSAKAQAPSVVYAFNGADGLNPNSLIPVPGGGYIGTTAAGGSTTGNGICFDAKQNDIGCGTIFELSSSGSIQSVSFPGGMGGAAPTGLIEGSDGNLYGTTTYGGASVSSGLCGVDSKGHNLGCGTIFSLSSYEIYPFNTPTIQYSFLGGADGAFPNPLIAGLNGVLYGSALSCLSNNPACPSNYGTLFSYSIYNLVSAPPYGFQALYTFSSNASNTQAGLQLAYPNSLVQGTDGNLYGTAQLGGDASCLTSGTTYYGCGGVFEYKTATGAVTGACFGGPCGSSAASPTFAAYPFTGTPFTLTEGSDGNFYGAMPTAYLYPITTPIQGSTATQYYSTDPTLGKPAVTDFSTIFQYVPASSSTSKPTLKTIYTFSGVGFGEGGAYYDGSDGGGATGGLTAASDGNFYGLSGINVFQLTAAQLDSPSTWPLKSLNPSGYFYSGDPVAGPTTRFAGSLIQGSDGNFYGNTYDGLDGSLVEIPSSPPLTAPIQLSLSASTVNYPTPVTLSWKISIAYSATAQQCFASGAWRYGVGGSPAIPAGTLVDGKASGSITFTPSYGGTVSYGLTCGGTESAAVANLIVNVPPINVTSTLPGGVVSTPYTADLNNSIQVTGGAGGPYFVTVENSGTNLPPGVCLSDGDGFCNDLPYSFDIPYTSGQEPGAGLILGTPTAAGLYPLSLQISDNAFNQGSAAITLTVAPSPAGISPSQPIPFTTATGNSPNSLIQAQDGNYYGTSATGGSTLNQRICFDADSNDVGCGTVFAVYPDNSIQVVANFPGGAGGSSPTGLVQYGDGYLYGTTAFGGTTLNQSNYSCADSGGNNIGCGTIFRVAPPASESANPVTPTVLYSFPGAPNGVEQGSFPNPLILGANGVMYGTTLACNYPIGNSPNQAGCAFDFGTIFEYTPRSAGLSATVSPTILYRFEESGGGGEMIYPNSLLMGSDGKLYGTVQEDNGNICPEHSQCGALFQFTLPSNPGGTGSLATLYNFSNPSTTYSAAPVDTVKKSGKEATKKLANHGSTPLSGPRSNVVIRQPGRGYAGLVGWELESIPTQLTEAADGSIYGTMPTQTEFGQGNGEGFTNVGQAFQYAPSKSAAASPTLNTISIGDWTNGLALASDGNFYGLDDGSIFQVPPASASSLSAVTLYSALPSGSTAAAVIQGYDGNLHGIATSTTGSSTYFTIPASPALAPPVQLTIPQAANSPLEGQPLTINWSVANAYSQTAQQCYAFSNDGVTWTGLQHGTLSNGVYSGSATVTPQYTGTYTFSLTCGGVESGSANVFVNYAPLTIQSSVLPNGVQGTPYTYALVATGGAGGNSFFIDPASLPPGLSLSANYGSSDGPNLPTSTTPSGILYGTPNQSGTYTFAVQVTDQASDTASANVTVTIAPNSPGVATPGLTSFLPTGANPAYPSGANPNALIQAWDSNYYGTTANGGNNPACPAGCGTVFRVNPDSSITPIASFPGGVGGSGPTGLIQGRDGNFYGTTSYGGSTVNLSNYSCADGAGNNIGCGTIFRVTPAGELTTLYSFQGVANGPEEGAFPNPLIVGADGFMYGTTLACNYPYQLPLPNDFTYCDYNAGTIFQFLSPAAGTSPSSVVPSILYTLSEFPNALLMGSDGYLYETSQLYENQYCQSQFGCGGLSRFTIPSASQPAVETQLWNFNEPGNYPVELAAKQKAAAKSSSLAHAKPNIVIRQPGKGFPPGFPNWEFEGSPSTLTEASDGSLYGTTPNQEQLGGTSYASYDEGFAFQYIAPGSASSPATRNTISIGNWSNGLLLASDGNFYSLDDGGIFQIPPTSPPPATPVSLYAALPAGSVANSMMLGSDGNFHGTATDGAGGSVFLIAPATPLTPSLQLVPSASAVDALTPVALSWSVYNAFSLTAQQCYAFVQNNATGAGNWSGLQPGTLANGRFSGSVTITPTKAGTFTYALTCGGTESAFVSVVVNPPAAAAPSFSLTSGPYVGTQTVTLKSATAGAQIYYALYGVIPTTSSTLYTGPIQVSKTEVINAIAVASGYSVSSVATASYHITPNAASPVFTPNPTAGSYTGTQTVSITSSTPGATIYYALYGLNPTTASTLYKGPISVSRTETIKAIAVAPGYAQSLVATAAYTIIPNAATPVFTPNPTAGSYTGTQTVSITSSTPGATIYYALYGLNPTTASTLYKGPISVSRTETIKAIAVAPGYAQSLVATAAYTIIPNAATPVFSPAPGSYNGTQTVKLTSSTPGATIYYALYGLNPTTASTLYKGPISVSRTETIKAIAVAPGYAQSAVATATYTIIPIAAAPVFSPAPGTYNGTQTVKLTSSTPGATIYYALYGLNPTTASTLYKGPISVSRTETIKAIAVAPGYAQSLVATAAYTIIPNAATPVFTPNPTAGSYTGTQTVSITSSTPGATIYYALYGLNPTTASTLYKGPISVSRTETIKAIAVAPGYAQSLVATAAYTIIPNAATPVFSPAPGSYNGTQTVKLTSSTPGATIYYALYGLNPTTASTLYKGPISVSRTETIKAIAVAPGYAQSAVATATYTIIPIAAAPVFSPAPGTYNATQIARIISSMSGATIDGGLKGVTPTFASVQYAKPSP